MSDLSDALEQLTHAFDPVAVLKGNELLEQSLLSLLRTVRTKLRMEVGFISRFDGDMRTFYLVDSAPGVDIVRAGGSDYRGESLCQRVVDGRAPQLIADAQRTAGASDLAAVKLVPVGAHISVPIVFSDGTVFGTFCVFSRYVIPELNHRSLAMCRVFADAIAAMIEEADALPLHESEHRIQLKNEVTELITKHGLKYVRVPLVNLNTGKQEGTELIPSLVRTTDNLASPLLLVHQAVRLGLAKLIGVNLMEQLFATLSALPDEHYVVINVTPEFLAEFSFTVWLSDDLCRRIVFEISEHDRVASYHELKRVLQPLRQSGIRLSIDNAGAGFASMQHILQLQPEFVKLDSCLTCGVASDTAQQAMLQALLLFSRSQGSTLVADGISNQQDEDYLLHSGISLGQYCQ
ncbi:EAL domain, c-di-GMP-specific phosphodiesterase class I (or its enzymatically inactive variant) [Thalassolituus maritimus]|uniref:EAL domain, c-di-GMP-specific phosphodiesterase class I (Or its enzymatically inactive variant) n=1 Tax=Thalassolituus maritimus TaxID=484498 RepID=A0A1N7PNC7_9GAMM|nr:EAL domain-containing protein [Thalassolituus maritimus]SIT12086.1 EAL domain, c-di-GMP-specific phosphodiesterase class I (or its enzymatically inactive variant) [Thalassolituus maritimus]